MTAHKYHPHSVPTLPPIDEDERQVVHVYPMFGRPHEVDGQPCWCDPDHEPYCGGWIITHNVDN